MVWCCGPMEALTPEWNTAPEKTQQEQPTDVSAGGYPGQRRQFARTDGNALIAAVPVQGGTGSNDLVSVTVPEGIAPGQTIAVLAPDGSRLVKATIPPGLGPGESFLVRLATPIQVGADAANATSMSLQPPGQSMAVANSPNFANSLDTYMTPAPNHPNFEHALGNWIPPSPEAKATAPMVMENETNKSNQVAEAVATPVNERGAPNDPKAPTGANGAPIPLAPPQQQPKQQVLGQPVNAQIEVAETRQEPEGTRSNSGGVPATPLNKNSTATTPQPPAAAVPKQKLLLVHVPSGLPAGSTMQVEVPGENRTLTAQVPEGVQSFHVAYTPRTNLPPALPAPSQQALPPPVPAPVQQQPRTPSPTLAPQPHRSSTGSGQRLLLVRVPPGTQAGTTLHVSVPDEPGRILAAQVPPGNVQEFHVSYEARPPQQQPQQQQRGASTPFTPQSQPFFNQSQQQQQPNGYFPPNSGSYYNQQQQQQQQQRQPYNGNNNYPGQQNNGGGMGNLFLPFLGGAALGAAGLATYDHFAHQNNGDANADTADYGAMGGGGGGDYGGADYGGDYTGVDYDMGGGDFGF